MRQAVRAAELRELSLQLSVEVHRADVWKGIHLGRDGSVTVLSFVLECPGDRLNLTALVLLARLLLSLQYSSVLETGST